MVKVICNATPLINFASINCLDILKSLFTEIVIPHAVYSETVESGFPNSETIVNGIEAAWLKVHNSTLRLLARLSSLPHLNSYCGCIVE